MAEVIQKSFKIIQQHFVCETDEAKIKWRKMLASAGL